MTERPLVVMGGVAATDVIRRRLADPDDEFAISPALDDEAISRGSVDLSLGHTFLVASRSGVTQIDARNPSQSRSLYREVRITDSGDPLIIHPRQLVLAVTFEYLSLPRDLCGLLQSRSTYGRLGLIAATATFVAAGYKGCPTLELVNAGEVPLAVRPKDPVCQLTLLNTNELETQPSRYQCATQPYPARHARALLV